ncbi:TolB family protein [Tenacibaculum caenipelagi]|nr:PD40 domain-containing protein [Tenacibaculum caenipelagi]
MKQLLILTGVISLNIGFAQEKNDITLKPQTIERQYLGQKPPGLVPEIFAPGIISIDSLIEGSITFNKEMNELFFQRREREESHNIYTMKLIKGKWSTPKQAFFSTNKKYLDLHPRFSPNGDRLYFGSTRPLNDSVKSSGLHQWYIKKGKSGWEDPVLLSEKLFENEWIMCVNSTEQGNLYFNSKEKEEKLEDEGIYYSVNQGGEYSKLKKMSNKINAPGKWIAHPYIAPDESYIIYDAERTSKYENGDLYISFNINGSWTKSYSLGSKINTEKSETGATVSPDGKYLFFSRGVIRTREDGSTYWLTDTYWVDFVQLKKELMEENILNN